MMLASRLRILGLLAFTCCFCVQMWNYSSVSVNTWKIKIENFFTMNTFDNHTRTWASNSISDTTTDAAQSVFLVDVNVSTLKYKVRHRNECQDVAENPRSYWRSENVSGLLNTSQRDIARMGLAFSCGVLDQDFLSKSPTSTLYPVEKFYLSEPPLVNIKSVSDVSQSVITSYNSSLQFKVEETATFKIEMRTIGGHPKQEGGDQIRAWLVDDSTKSKMAAKVVDLNNGTYIVSASLLWPGKLRLHVALAYPREYIRALLYTHRVFKAFRHIAAVFHQNAASEATPCYHTPVVPGFGPSELCNLTHINGSPWFCGGPIKPQLTCSDYTGTVVISSPDIHPVTDAEMELFRRSCSFDQDNSFQVTLEFNLTKVIEFPSYATGFVPVNNVQTLWNISTFTYLRPRYSKDVSATLKEPRIRRIPNNFELNVLPGNSAAKIPCNKVLPQITWAQEIPTGHLSQNTWYPRFCSNTKPDYSQCFQNKQILIFGDSNGRSHYYNIIRHAKCAEIKKALAVHWHRPLLCVNKGNNFSVSWNPHANPFINGGVMATTDSLVPTSTAIDEIPSQGNYLIILNHYYHLTTTHLSAIDFLFRGIKDALVRLFQRNPNVQVVLQGPHIAWFGWPEHYAAGDMLGISMQDLQKEIFHDIQDKVLFVSPWDMTIATQNWDYHPSMNIFTTIAELMCGR